MEKKEKHHKNGLLVLRVFIHICPLVPWCYTTYKIRIEVKRYLFFDEKDKNFWFGLYLYSKAVWIYWKFSSLNIVLFWISFHGENLLGHYTVYFLPLPLSSLLKQREEEKGNEVAKPVLFHFFQRILSILPSYIGNFFQELCFFFTKYALWRFF